MIKAWLVANAFLHSEKFNEHYTWLLEAGNRHGIRLQYKTNAELFPVLESGKGITFGSKEEERPDCVLFWDKDIRLADALRAASIPVFNTPEAIALCDDKYATLLKVMREAPDIRIPKTVQAPMTFQGIGYTELSFLEEVSEILGFPMVLKECFGSFGEQVYLIANLAQLQQKVTELAGTPLLFQEYIAESHGRDIRLQVVGKEVVASMYRYADKDFRANITNGGNMKAYEPSAEQKKLALRACEILGLDFAGVDILFGKDEQGREIPVLCEVNSNAHFRNIYNCTGVNVADYIMQYITDTMKKENG